MHDIMIKNWGKKDLRSKVERDERAIILLLYGKEKAIKLIIRKRRVNFVNLHERAIPHTGKWKKSQRVYSVEAKVWRAWKGKTKLQSRVKWGKNSTFASVLTL